MASRRRSYHQGDRTVMEGQKLSAVIQYAELLDIDERHWSVESNRVGLTSEDPLRLAVLHWHPPWHDQLQNDPFPSAATKRVPLIVKLNPTDARGHRVLVTVTDDIDPRRTFNRPASMGEEGALAAGLALMRCAFARCGLYAQTFVASNNSHAAVAEEEEEEEVPSSSTLLMTLGADPAEPHLIHGHAVARGPVGACCVAAGVPLQGPPLGEEFALKGPKVPYRGASEAAAVASRLRTELAALCAEAWTMLSLEVCVTPFPSNKTETATTTTAPTGDSAATAQPTSGDDSVNSEDDTSEPTIEASCAIGLCRQLLEEESPVENTSSKAKEVEATDGEAGDLVSDTPREQAARHLWDLSCSLSEAASLVNRFNLHGICAHVLVQQQQKQQQQQQQINSTEGAASSTHPLFTPAHRLLELTCGIAANLATYVSLRRTLRRDKVLVEAAARASFLSVCNDPPTLRECARLFSALLRLDGGDDDDDDDGDDGGSSGGDIADKDADDADDENGVDGDGRGFLRQILSAGVLGKACWVLAATTDPDLVGVVCEMLDLTFFFEPALFLECCLLGKSSAGVAVEEDEEEEAPPLLLGAVLASAVHEWFSRPGKKGGGERSGDGGTEEGRDDDDDDDDEVRGELGTVNAGRLLDLISSTASAATSAATDSARSDPDSNQDHHPNLILALLPVLPSLADVILVGTREHSPSLVAKAAIALSTVLLPAAQELDGSSRLDTSGGDYAFSLNDGGGTGERGEGGEGGVSVGGDGDSGEGGGDNSAEPSPPHLLPIDAELAAALISHVLLPFFTASGPAVSAAAQIGSSYISRDSRSIKSTSTSASSGSSSSSTSSISSCGGCGEDGIDGTTCNSQPLSGAVAAIPYSTRVAAAQAAFALLEHQLAYEHRCVESLAARGGDDNNSIAGSLSPLSEECSLSLHPTSTTTSTTSTSPTTRSLSTRQLLRAQAAKLNERRAAAGWQHRQRGTKRRAGASSLDGGGDDGGGGGEPQHGLSLTGSGTHNEKIPEEIIPRLVSLELAL